MWLAHDWRSERKVQSPITNDEPILSIPSARIAISPRVPNGICWGALLRITKGLDLWALSLSGEGGEGEPWDAREPGRRSNAYIAESGNFHLFVDLPA